MKNVFWNDTEIERDIYYESECCGYARENDIREAIAEYERMNEWD
jgi:hypothetical protein